MPWLLNTAVIDQGEQLNPRFPMLILCCVARASCLLVLLLFFEFISVQENCPFAFYFVQCSFPARYDCLSKVWIPVWLNAYSLLVFHLAAVQIVLCYWLGFFLTHTSSHLRGLPDMVFYPLLFTSVFEGRCMTRNIHLKCFCTLSCFETHQYQLFLVFIQHQYNDVAS